ncbi:MAG: S46 family peptidase [Bacteroidales bacterium]|nr:S46 family peptidase [Bacteroidales bacterium]
MKKLVLIFLGAILSGTGLLAYTPPDEGMWLPMFVERLNYTDMEKMGLNLSADEIYSINNASIKDAIVGLSSDSQPTGYFCTGEIVSEQGLMFTNHHCGYDIIQQHSSLEHDYLKDGFWARNFSEELPNEALTASFLIKMDDVTDSIVPFLSDSMSSAERSGKVRELRRKLENSLSEDGTYNVVVKSFFEGNEYYRFVYQVYTDVRLVGAPPSSIGKFGGDTDNWMWPRHTGDFSIFRVYTAPDGSPADYAEENIPLKPKYHLPISLKGVEKDDFAMIWGYPGSTDRYMTSYGVQFALDHYNPAMIDVLGKRLEIMKEDMDADRDVDIKYASTYAGLANYWKYLIGQSRGVKRLHVVDDKKQLEEAFMNWANADEARKEKYGNALNEIKEAYEANEANIKPLLYYNLGLMGPGIIGFAQTFNQLEQQLENKKENPEAPGETAEALKESAKEHFKDYNAPTDQKLLAGLYRMFANDIPESQHPEFLKEINKKYKGDYDKFAADVFDKSVFGSAEKVNEFLDNPKAKTIAKDPAYILANEVMGAMMGSMQAYRASQGGMNEGARLFVAGLREMKPDKVFYPDANSTMRLTYGSVEDYYPADAIHYDYVTHLSGVMEKEDPTNDEFIVEARLKELYDLKDFGRYGTDDGRLVVGFLTTNDITGGNSGSPVINGNGELIGIAFDGNWEAMSGDIAFEPELQRTICVDARYVLFIIDKFAGATNLIDELTIIQ